jgi:glycosyltransferase involved in cell wall biosynthesis
MRFAVDAHAIGCHLTGNEVYIRNLLNEFSRLDRENEFVAYVSQPDAPAQIPDRMEKRMVSTNPYKRLGWDLARRAKQDRADLLHVQYTAPLGCSIPFVVSVHDVSYLECPQYFTKFRAAQLRLTVKRTLARASRVLTPSEFSRRAILNHYDLPEDRVVAIHNAVSNRFRPVEREAAQALVREKFNIPAPFILTVGDLQPRKNHKGLLAAFEEMLRAHPHLPHHLVFVGKETWYSPELHKIVKESAVAGRVHFAGFVDDEDIVYFYGASDLLVFPSFYEGFGLPILEGMACARAVACSNTTAMPEVANAAGILFDPTSTSEMTRAMADVLLDSELRQRLERLGAARAAGFSWEIAAQRTLDVYYDVVGGKPRRKAASKPAAKVRAS